MFKKRTVKKDPQPSSNETTNKSDKLVLSSSSSSSSKRKLWSEEENIDEDLEKESKGVVASKESFLMLKKRKKALGIAVDKQEVELDEQYTEDTHENLSGNIKFSEKESKEPLQKMNILMDYEPEVCKDYKLTGYCGYGDSCKFIHSRDDYIKGWKSTTDWRTGGKNPSSADNIADDVPFKCVLCKKDYTSPIITSCKHCFCQKCFIERLKVTSDCVICGEDTQGTMKPVPKSFHQKKQVPFIA